MTFQRPITANEKLYLAGKRHFSDVIIQAVIEGSGIIDVSQLENAVKAVSNVFPGCRLKQKGNLWVADAPPPQVIQLDEALEFTDFNSIVKIDGEFDATIGRTCEILVTHEETGNDAKTTIIFRALHAVMDGKGLALWINAVFQKLANKPIIHVESSLTDDSLLAETKAPIRTEEPKLPQCAGPALTKNKAIDYDFNFARISLRGVHPTIVAKLAQGVASLLMQKESDKGTLMIPVDMRNSLDHELELSSANLSLPIFVDLDKPADHADYTRLILDKLENKKQLARGRNDWLMRCAPGALLSWMLGLLWRKQLKSGKYLVSSLVSHTGKNNREDFSCPGFEARTIVFVPCPIPIAPFSMVITETEDTEICLVAGNAIYSNVAELLNKLVHAAGLKRFIKPKQVCKAVATSHKDNPLFANRYDNFDQVEFSGLHQLFERQAELTPEARCLVFKDKELTYNQVNKRANQLANYLLSKGLKKGDFIGVGLERSFDTIISILSIFKAGGVYVPIEPTMPRERLIYMLDDCNPRFVISSMKHSVLYDCAHTVIPLEKSAPEISDFSTENPSVKLGTNDLCYMIYTSGSTGNPKGTMNYHLALINHFQWMHDQFPLTTHDVTFQKTPLSFDASLLEIFLPLQHGASIVVTEPGKNLDGGYLLDVIKKHSISYISIAPSVIASMLSAARDESFPSVLYILMGGDIFTAALATRLRKTFPNAELHNLYGPAEAAIDTLAFKIPDEVTSDRIPIGKPISNAKAYVVDKDMQLVSPGETGELVISGVSIGAGYYNQPELTCEKYISNPFDGGIYKVAYRTGDLANTLPDGNIMFIGRSDHQVKVRGVRIELGEIEHCLNSIDQIDEAVVVVKHLESDNVLRAFYTLRSSKEQIPSHKVRTLLTEMLPEYMVPSVFVCLDAMPLNPNGKIDRRALEKRELHASDALIDDINNIDPKFEERLLRIWESVLNQKAFRGSNFFDLGGNSMLAIELIKCINGEFGSDLRAHDIFNSPAFTDILLILVQKNRS